MSLPSPFPVVQGVETAMLAPAWWTAAGYTTDMANPHVDTAAGTGQLVALGMLAPVALLFLAARLYTAVRIVGHLRLDDYLLLTAAGFLLADQALIVYSLGANYYIGVHIWETSVDRATMANFLMEIVTFNTILGTVFAKLALCVFYLRISPARWYRRAILLTGALTVTAFSTVFLAVLLACRPLAAAWDLRLAGLPSTTCIARPPFYLLQAVAGAVTDLLLMAIPIYTILGLRLSARQKCAVAAWFTAGLLTLLAAVARLVVLLPSLMSTDTTWNLAGAAMWVTVEANLFVVCGSLPTFRIFLNHVAPRLLGERSGGSLAPTAGCGGTPASPGAAGVQFALRTFGAGPESPRRPFDALSEVEAGGGLTWSSWFDDDVDGDGDDDHNHDEGVRGGARGAREQGGGIVLDVYAPRHEGHGGVDEAQGQQELEERGPAGRHDSPDSGSDDSSIRRGESGKVCRTCDRRLGRTSSSPILRHREDAVEYCPRCT